MKNKDMIERMLAARGRPSHVTKAKIATGEIDDRKLDMLTLRHAAKVAENKFMAYVKFTSPDPQYPGDPTKSSYQDKLFHRSIAQHVEDLIMGRTDYKQMILCMPPRHGKTELCTRKLSAWVSGKFPKWDIVLASYSDVMASDFGGEVRANLYSQGHKAVFPDYRLRRGGTARDNIQTVEGGRIVSVGRGGTLTGRGMCLGIGDDLLKDHEEARSQATRDIAWNWFVRVFMTRRMGPKLVLLCMTRWHSDDIIGRLTDPENPHYSAKQASKWKIINLPALAEEDDVLGRAVGEPLWPERFDADFLDGQKDLDPLAFASLYQQSPTVADGTLFNRENIRWYDPSRPGHPGGLPDDLRYYCASDHALGLKQRNDPSCMLKVGVDKNDDIYLVECDWRKMDSLAQSEAILTMANNTRKPLVWWAEKDKVSMAIGPFLRKHSLETKRYVNMKEIAPIQDKQQRAQSMVARIAQQKVYFPRGISWADKGVEELMAFPNGLHDDFVDALAYIGLGLGNIFGMRTYEPDDIEPKFGTLNWVKFHDKWSKGRRETAKMGTF